MDLTGGIEGENKPLSIELCDMLIEFREGYWMGPRTVLIFSVRGQQDQRVSMGLDEITFTPLAVFENRRQLYGQNIGKELQAWHIDYRSATYPSRKTLTPSRNATDAINGPARWELNSGDPLEIRLVFDCRGFSSGELVIPVYEEDGSLLEFKLTVEPIETGLPGTL